MKRDGFSVRLIGLCGRLALIPAIANFLGLAACDSISETVALTTGVVVGATVVGANIPGHEIEQIYYLGVFDPQEQVPPTIYRVRVHGQASAYSGTKFASGWVPAQVIDSLNTHVGFDVNDPSKPNVQLTKGAEADIARLTPGRRLVQFGPEGFREAPKDHRLVIVMGASPEAFFEAIDQALGQVGRAIQVKQDADLKGELFKALVLLRAQRDRLDDLSRDVELELVRQEQARVTPAPAPSPPASPEPQGDAPDAANPDAEATAPAPSPPTVPPEPGSTSTTSTTTTTTTTTRGGGAPNPSNTDSTGGSAGGQT